MKVLHKKNQGKSMRNEGGYSREIFPTWVRFLRLFMELQDDLRSLIDEVRVLPG